MNEIKKLLKGVNFDRITMKVGAETLKDVVRRARAVNPQLLRDVIQKAIDGATEPELLRFILDHQAITPTGGQRLAEMDDDDFLRGLTHASTAPSFMDDSQYAGGQRQVSGDQRNLGEIDDDDLLRSLTNPSSTPFFE